MVLWVIMVLLEPIDVLNDCITGRSMNRYQFSCETMLKVQTAELVPTTLFTEKIRFVSLA